MNNTFLQLFIALLSLLLFLRIHWIQASSTSLMRLMRMRRQNILNEIDLIKQNELQRKDIIEALSFLNLVAKMYLNSAINTNMLRTFEGIMIKTLEMEVVKTEYSKIFSEFKYDLKTAEPPYINLIYTINLIKISNKLLKNKSFLAIIYTRIYLLIKIIKFKITPGSKRNWKLAENVFADLKI